VKTPRILAIVAAFLLGFTGATPAWASGAVVLLSKENRIYRLILKGLSAELPSAPSVVQMGAAEDAQSVKKTIQSMKPDVLVAVGDEAARWALAEWKSSPILLAGVVDTLLPENDSNVTGVALNLPPDVYLKTIHEYLPAARRVGTIYSPLVQPNLGRSLQNAAEKHGIKINAVPASTNRDFVLSLQTMKHQIDAFLVTFDPLVLTPEAFQYLVQFSLSQDIPLVVPALVLLKSGGVLSLEVDYEALGVQVAGLAERILSKGQTGGSRSLLAPEKWQVGVNLKVGRALNVDISPEAVGKADRVYE
jgi:putative ABC transport system substrate-binding protein